jgi:hypothetical protein
MNLRRYSLFLIVAILTFVIGVTSAVVVGSVNPFPQMHRCRRARLNSLRMPDKRLTVSTVYRSDGTILRTYEVEKTEWMDKLAEEPGPTTTTTTTTAPPAVKVESQSIK